MSACTLDKRWYIHLAAGLLTFLGGVAVLLPCRVLWYLFCVPPKHAGQTWRRKETTGWRADCARLRAAALQLTSANNIFSKMLEGATCWHEHVSRGDVQLYDKTISYRQMMVIWLLNMVAVFIYLVDASTFSRSNCGTVRDDLRQIIWLCLCGCFVLFYILRFIAAADKLYMWLDLYSVVDHFTIGPSLVAFYLDSNWLGLKFLRLLWLLKLPDVLQMTSILKSKRSIRLVQIASIYLGCWLASSGFVHMSENNGDPHKDWQNGQGLSYLECVYWLLVTMSTVGFGDIYPTTDISRVFTVIFIMGSFVMFGSLIPEMVKYVGSTSHHSKVYKRTFGRRHIVVCGHITYESVSTFLANFIHEDCNTTDTDIVFVDPQKPGLELEAFFKRHFNDVTFIQSTVMDITTLANMKMRAADSCIILANRKAEHPSDEDSSNIMRVAAIKNYCPSIRIIVQLLLHKNKLHLLHIPNWNWQQGDEVICCSQLKHGIMAQSCLAPGFATLLSNLFTLRSSPTRLTTGWLAEYRYGAGHEIYVESFSVGFHGMTFSEAVKTCYETWSMLLLAVSITDHHSKRQLKVNPGSKLTIGPNTTGFFLAQSPADAHRVATYCPTPEPASEENIQLQSVQLSEKQASDESLPTGRHSSTGACFSDESDGESWYDVEVNGKMVWTNVPRSGSRKEMLDFTGTTHWCPSQDLGDCVLNQEQLQQLDLRGHVIVCMAAKEDDPVSGLVNFIVPLRASSFRQQELMDIVILSEKSCLEKGWTKLANFPKLYIFEGSAMFRSDLRAINLTACTMCVILSSERAVTVDNTVVDKDSILTTLNIQGMFREQLHQQIQSYDMVASPEASSPEANNPETSRHMTACSEIPLITQLETDSSVMFLDQDDDDDPDVPIYMTLPYISGSVFADSALDCLMSCAYLCPQSLELIRALSTGAQTGEFEQVVCDGMGMVMREALEDVTGVRNRCHLAQLSLQYGLLETLQHNLRYGELLVEAMTAYGILCLGLHRLIDPTVADPRVRRRYVLTNPTFHTPLLLSDKVYVLMPYQLDVPSNEEVPSPSETVPPLSETDSCPQPLLEDKDGRVAWAEDQTSTPAVCTL